LISDFDALCKKVLEIDKNLRSARVINDVRRLIAGGMRAGVESLESLKNDELLFMNLAPEVKLKVRQLEIPVYEYIKRKKHSS
jgi:hypothetical protein